MSARPLITDHWFREGPVQPDGSDGYWICDRCGQHRGDHLQIEGHWRNPLHTFVQQRYWRPHCKTCGRHHRHTTHTPWLWEQLEAPSARQDRTCPCASGSPEMYEGTLRDCPIHGERRTEGER